MALATYVQRRVRIDNARWVGRRWRALAAIGGLSALAVAGIMAIPAPASWLVWRGVLAGTVLGANGMAIVVSVTRMGDPLVRGELAEQWSAAALRKAGRWLVTSNLAFEHLDVDHVVVTSAAVLAVETKYRGTGYNAEINQQRHQRELAAAVRGAHKVSLLLQSQKLRNCTVVLPVLMVWGAGKPTLQLGYHIESGVFVLDGDEPQLWAHLFSAAVLDRHLQQRLHAAIQLHAQKKAQFDSGQQTCLHRAMWASFREGTSQAALQRRRRADLLKALQATSPPPPPATSPD